MVPSSPSSSPSTAKDRPQLLVAPLLVGQDKVSDGFGKLGALPLAFEFSCMECVGGLRRQSHGFDRIGRRAQLMIRHVRRRNRVARRASNFSGCGVRRLACCRVGSEGRLPGLIDRGPTPRPCTGSLYRSTRSIVVRILGSKRRQDMISAVRSPSSEQPMPRKIEDPAALRTDQPSSILPQLSHRPWRSRVQPRGWHRLAPSPVLGHLEDTPSRRRRWPWPDPPRRVSPTVIAPWETAEITAIGGSVSRTVRPVPSQCAALYRL
jgi:hypothetical protein